MKFIYLVRHAKSSWGNIELPDFERPLNDRGKKDAPLMAKRLIDRNVDIDLFVTSPAKRAKRTAKLFCEEFKANEHKILMVDELYHASAETFGKVISELNDKYKHVALFSHNPGITDFVNSLVKDIRIDNMPTCAVFAIKTDISKWKDFNGADKKLLFFDYPKKVT